MVVSGDTEPPSVRFEPLRPASRGRLIAAFVFGPILWLVALTIAAWLFENSWAIPLGIAVTVASFIVSVLVLALVHRGRRREEERYANSR